MWCEGCACASNHCRIWQGRHTPRVPTWSVQPGSTCRLVSAPLQSRAARRQHMAELAHAPPVAGSATDTALLRGGGEGPAGGGGVPLHASFPPAGQPDLVRAGQKDEFYVQACSRSRRRWNKAPRECTTHQAVSVCVRQLSQRLRDTLLDVTQRLAGHRHAMAWEEEARRPCPASSRCESHALRRQTGVSGQRGAVLRARHRLRVTHAGRGVLRPAHGAYSVTRLQCGLVLTPPSCAQVTSTAQRPVSTLRRLLLMTLQTVVPYALQREQCVGKQPALAHNKTLTLPTAGAWRPAGASQQLQTHARPQDQTRTRPRLRHPHPLWWLPGDCG